jgi:hypothetical protein
MKLSQMQPKTRLGCGFLCVSVLLTCILLAINGLIVANVYYASRPGLPDALQDQRVAQAIVFLGPIFLLFIEWWICDVALDWLRPMQQPADKG